jgi:PAS domain S-box-containing protein
MQDKKKTKGELIEELVSLRQKVEELEWSQSAPTSEEKLISPSEAKYRRLFETATIGIFQSSPEGKVIAANPEFARMFGYNSPEDVIVSVKDVSLDLYVDPQRRSEIVSLLMENPSLRSVENLYRRKDGTTFTGKLYIWSARDEEGHLLPIEGFVADITELVKKEEEIKQRSQYYEHLIDSTHDPLHVVDEELSIVLANKRFNNWTDNLGIADGMVGKQVNELFTFLPDQVLDEYREVFRTGKTKVTYDETEIGNRTYYTETTKTPIFSDDGTVWQVITVVRDISEKKCLEEDLKRSETKYRERLEELVEERTRELENRTKTLEEVNIALKVLLQSREEAKKELEDRFVMNVKKLIIPFAEKMKRTRLDMQQQAYLDIMETQLRDMASPLIKKMHQFGFTATEVEVAYLIKEGKSTKEIAGIMEIGVSTINTHRINIRKKLGISTKNVNLTSKLQSFD